jgi:hypothetical protein
MAKLTTSHRIAGAFASGSLAWATAALMTMAPKRERLPNRRASENYTFELHGLRYTATVSRFADGGSVRCS